MNTKTLLLVMSLILSFWAMADLPKGITPLSGVDPSLPDTELKFLDSLVKDADILAIGESVHGSGGYRSLQHRLAKYLIEKKGFRTLMVENPVIRSIGLTKWLDTCESGQAAPIDLLDQPIEEDLAFFNWLCSYNRAHPTDRVRFRGMDIWDRPWEHQARLEDLNQKLNLKFDELLKLTHDHCWFHNQNSWVNYSAMMKVLQQYKMIPPVDYGPCTKSIEQMRWDVQRKMDDTPNNQRHSLYDFLQSLDTALGFQVDYNFAYQCRGKSWDGRDLAQSRNELNIWRQEGKKKAIIITHTSHASKMESPTDFWGFGSGAIHSGVSYLRKILGDRVRTLGLTGYEITGVQGNFLKPTSVESLDLTLHQMGLSVALVNPSSEFVRSHKRWWVHNENNPTAFPDGVYEVPRDNFDLFIFVDKSLVGKAILPWRSVWLW
jgi:hypothetical protein